MVNNHYQASDTGFGLISFSDGLAVAVHYRYQESVAQSEIMSVTVSLFSLQPDTTKI